MCGGCERTDFQQFILWEGAVVLKEPIFNSFLLRESVKVLNEPICKFLLWECVVVMNKLIFNNSYKWVPLKPDILGA